LVNSGRRGLDDDRNLSEHLPEKLVASHSQRRFDLGIMSLHLPSTGALSDQSVI